jgi:hypothetical protein
MIKTRSMPARLIAIYLLGVREAVGFREDTVNQMPDAIDEKILGGLSNRPSKAVVSRSLRRSVVVGGESIGSLFLVLLRVRLRIT